MSSQRFFLPESSFQAGQVLLPAAVQHQLKSVLRMAAGDQVLALGPQGMEYRLLLELNMEGNFTGKILSRQKNTAEALTQIALYLPLTQREKFEWVLQKGTETGVATFRPLITLRSLVQDGAVFDKKRERWEAILREAAEQCGRGRVPALLPPLRLNAALDSAVQAHDCCLAAWEDEAQTSLKDALVDFAGMGSLGLFVGPEGGFDASEVDLMRQKGVRLFSLGPRILRLETAAILAPALVLFHLGEMDARAR